MVMISLIAFVVLGLGLTYVGQRVHVMNLGYELAALERRLDEALREQEFLMLGIAQARSLIESNTSLQQRWEWFDRANINT